MGTDGSSPLRSTGESANFGPPLLGWTPPTCKSASHVTVAGCLNVKPLLNDKPDETIIDKAAPNWHRLANILDARLATSKWLAGDNVTIADIALAAPMHCA
jgi:glutathione S-transferase